MLQCINMFNNTSHETTYFWFGEVQYMIFQLSLSLPEFYFGSMFNVLIV